MKNDHAWMCCTYLIPPPPVQWYDICLLLSPIKLRIKRGSEGGREGGRVREREREISKHTLAIVSKL